MSTPDLLNPEQNEQGSYGSGINFNETFNLLGIQPETETETETPTEKSTENPVESPIEDGENPAETEIPAETQSENSAETPSENSAETPYEEPTEQSGEIPAETETPTENETQQNPEKEKTVEEEFKDLFDIIMSTNPKYLSSGNWTIGVTNGDEPGEMCLILEIKKMISEDGENVIEQSRFIKGENGEFRRDEIKLVGDSDERETVVSKDNLDEEDIKSQMSFYKRVLNNFIYENLRSELNDAQKNYENGVSKVTKETSKELNGLENEVLGNR